MADLIDYTNSVKQKLDGKAPTGHNHDDRYYTETEADGRFIQDSDPRLTDARIPTAHSHPISGVTGLQTALDGKQAAGSYAAAGHTHTAAAVTDLTETVQDIVGALLVAGVNTTITYDDTAGTVTINSTASGGGGGETDPEIVRDVIGGALVAGAGIQIAVNDAADTITVTSTAVQPTRAITAGTGLTGGGDLSANRSIAVDFGQVATAAQGGKADTASQPGHTHTLDQATDTATRVAMTPAERAKLGGVADGAEVNVNADWNAASGAAQILNKPTIGTAAAAAATDFASAAQGAKADTASQRAATVAEMTAGTYPVGAMVSTLGYHAAHDGGAASYRVIAAASKSYDIAGTGVAFRPAISGTINPKQFGTVNDGTALDNWGLQRCYDYSHDLGIGHIDGLGLLYTIGTVNPYDAAFRGWAHTGALVRAGRKLSNFRFRIASGSTNGTCALSIRMDDDGKDIILEDIKIDGNKNNVVKLAEHDNKEDGGLHLIHVYHPSDDILPKVEEFHPCGNIYMRRVKFDNQFSYGVRVDHLDCLMRLEDCEWDHYGIAAQANTTRFEVRGGIVRMHAPRAGMVAASFQSEIELGGNYVGTKRQNISIRGVRVTADEGVLDPFVFKVHYSTMQGVAWDSIELRDCNLTGTASGIFLFNNTATMMNVDEIVLHGNRRPGSVLLSASGASITIKDVHWDNNSSGVAGNGSALGQIGFNACTVNNISVQRHHFAGSNSIVLSSNNIGRMVLRDCTSGALGTFGVFRNNASRIGVFRVLDSQFEAFSQSVIWEAIFDRVEFDNVRFTVATSPNGLHSRIMYLRTNARTDVWMKDVLIQGAGPRASDNGLMLFDAGVTDGYVHLNNVRYERASIPHAQGLASPATRLVRENCAPLDAPVADAPVYTTATRPQGFGNGQVFDSTLGKPVWVKTPGVRAVSTVTITAGASTGGDVTVTLNGVGHVVTVAGSDTTPDLVAAKLRAVSYPGWIVSGTTSAVVFTATTVGTTSAPSFSGGTTGATATATATAAGAATVWVDAAGTTV